MTGSPTLAGDFARLRRDLEAGLSLPASWYVDAGILAEEQARIIHRSWQYVGRVEQVAGPGDFFTGTAGEIPVVVVRDGAGLNAFVNVCRHRRHLVMSGAGNCKLMQCPYHAWSYALDGSLRAAPRADREEGFAREEYPLLPIRVETWGPFVFVNADPGAASLAEALGPLPERIAASGLDLGSLRFHGREEWTGAANWKVMLENYLECYHCAVAHPGFSSVMDVRQDAYALSGDGNVFSQVAPIRETARQGTGKAAAYDPAGAVTQGQYHLLWPNFTIDINPGHPNLSVDVWIPAGPERTRGFTDTFFGPDVPEEWAREMVAFNHQVSAEDDELTDSVQRGLRAGIPAQGRFLARSEQLVIEFQKRVLETLAS